MRSVERDSTKSARYNVNVFALSMCSCACACPRVVLLHYASMRCVLEESIAYGCTVAQAACQSAAITETMHRCRVYRCMGV